MNFMQTMFMLIITYCISINASDNNISKNSENCIKKTNTSSKFSDIPYEIIENIMNFLGKESLKIKDLNKNSRKKYFKVKEFNTNKGIIVKFPKEYDFKFLKDDLFKVNKANILITNFDTPSKTINYISRFIICYGKKIKKIYFSICGYRSYSNYYKDFSKEIEKSEITNFKGIQVSMFNGEKNFFPSLLIKNKSLEEFTIIDSKLYHVSKNHVKDISSLKTLRLINTNICKYTLFELIKNNKNLENLIVINEDLSNISENHLKNITSLKKLKLIELEKPKINFIAQVVNKNKKLENLIINNVNWNNIEKENLKKLFTKPVASIKKIHLKSSTIEFKTICAITKTFGNSLEELDFRDTIIYDENHIKSTLYRTYSEKDLIKLFKYLKNLKIIYISNTVHEKYMDKIKKLLPKNVCFNY